MEAGCGGDCCVGACRLSASPWGNRGGLCFERSLLLSACLPHFGQWCEALASACICSGGNGGPGTLSDLAHDDSCEGTETQLLTLLSNLRISPRFSGILPLPIIFLLLWLHSSDSIPLPPVVLSRPPVPCWAEVVLLCVLACCLNQGWKLNFPS